MTFSGTSLSVWQHPRDALPWETQLHHSFPSHSIRHSRVQLTLLPLSSFVPLLGVNSLDRVSALTFVEACYSGPPVCAVGQKVGRSEMLYTTDLVLQLLHQWGFTEDMQACRCGN